MDEYEGDNNHDHFQRTPEFADEVKALPDEIRQEFLDFLISSITSEFSGCVLYNEIQKHVGNPDIKRLMRFMARDESRHAGFINQSLKDFDLGVDLGGLKRTKAYTYFKPKYIFYATYLSEKIGYARYITIFRQLEKHPEKRFHPDLSLVRALVQRRIPARRIVRADHARSAAPAARRQRALDPLLPARGLRDDVRARPHRGPSCTSRWGSIPTDYDYTVFRITSEISKQVFPITLDTDHPTFRRGLERLFAISQEMADAKARGGLVGRRSPGAWRRARACHLRPPVLPADKTPRPAAHGLHAPGLVGNGRRRRSRRARWTSSRRSRSRFSPGGPAPG